MPKPPDRVQVAKYELAADGGDPLDNEMGFPTAADSTEDGLQAAGLFFGESGQNAGDEVVGVYRETNELVFFDEQIPGGITLAELLTSNAPITEVDGDFVTTVAGELVTVA